MEELLDKYGNPLAEKVLMKNSVSCIKLLVFGFFV